MGFIGFLKKFQTVEQLDCDTPLPVHVDEKGVVIQCFLTDVCTAWLNGKELLVATSSEEVLIIDGKTKELNFLTSIKSRSITADRNGNVFVCDHSDENIHRFNLNSQDRDVGVLLKAGDHGLGKPVMIRWFNSMPYLVVAHIINEKINISMVKVD